MFSSKHVDTDARRAGLITASSTQMQIIYSRLYTILWGRLQNVMFLSIFISCLQVKIAKILKTWLEYAISTQFTVVIFVTYFDQLLLSFMLSQNVIVSRLEAKEQINISYKLF